MTFIGLNKNMFKVVLFMKWYQMLRNQRLKIFKSLKHHPK